MWLPEALYERLPLLYTLTAALCLWLLGASFASTLSSVLLVTAAVLTLSQRRSARKPPPPLKRRRAVRA